MYLTFEEYIEMGGTLDATTFSDIAYEAESYIDWYTFNRLWNESEIPERVKTCMYHIIGLMQKEMDLDFNGSSNATGTEQTGTGQVASQSNDGVSISYNIISAKDAIEMARKDVDNTIKRYLQGVTNSLGRKLLYRGIYPDE